MNDADEMVVGARAFSKEFDRRLSDLDAEERDYVQNSGLLTGTSAFSNFLLSAARDPDSLTLWRNYGVSEVAYSIELDASVGLVPLEATQGERHPSPPPDYYSNAPDDYAEDGSPIYFEPDPDALLCMGGDWRDVSYISGEDDPQIRAQFDAVIGRFRERRTSSVRTIPIYSLTNSPLDFLKDRGFEDEREVR